MNKSMIFLRIYTKNVLESDRSRTTFNSVTCAPVTDSLLLFAKYHD